MADQEMLETYKSVMGNPAKGAAEDNVEECFDRCNFCYPYILTMIDEIENNCKHYDPETMFSPIENTKGNFIHFLGAWNPDCIDNWFPEDSWLESVYGTGEKC